MWLNWGPCTLHVGSVLIMYWYAHRPKVVKAVDDRLYVRMGARAAGQTRHVRRNTGHIFIFSRSETSTHQIRVRVIVGGDSCRLLYTVAGTDVQTVMRHTGFGLLVQNVSQAAGFNPRKCHGAKRGRAIRDVPQFVILITAPGDTTEHSKPARRLHSFLVAVRHYPVPRTPY